MTALIFVTCLLAGGDCRPHMQTEGLGLMECQLQSQRIAAKWATEHPKRVVKRIICTDEKRVDYYLGREQA